MTVDRTRAGPARASSGPTPRPAESALSPAAVGGSVGYALFLQGTIGNQAATRILATDGAGRVQRKRAAGACPHAPTETGWKGLAQQFEQGSRAECAERIVLQEAITDEAIRGLDLEDLVLLESRMRGRIHIVEGLWAVTPEDKRSRQVETWLPSARRHWEVVKAELKPRQNAIEAQENFWPTIDAAQDQLSGIGRAILANVAPIAWKLVESAWSYELTPEEKVRCGYLTRSQIRGLLEDPKEARPDYYDAAWLGPRMSNAAWSISQAFKASRGGDASHAAAAVAAELADIESGAVKGLTNLGTQKPDVACRGKVAQDNACRLAWALAHHAAEQKKSIYALLPINGPATGPDLGEAERLTGAVAEMNRQDPPPNRVGLPPVVEVRWNDTWWDARVLARSGDQRFVHYVGWDSAWDEWVDASRVREKEGIAPGSEHAVRWKDGVRYQVQVMEVGAGEHEGQCYVRWLGFGEAYDSWINAWRLRSSP